MAIRKSIRNIITDIPGIYDIPHAEYLSDPIEGGSLSASGVYTIATQCPAVFKYGQKHAVNKRCYDIGTAAHLMMLEPEKFHDSVEIIQGVSAKGEPSRGYSSADARTKRDAAYAAGKIPLLPDEAEMVFAMHRSLWSDPIAKHAFKPGSGKAEQSIFWRDQDFGLVCRTRPDWLPNSMSYITNLKSAASAHPDDISKSIYSMGYFAKCAHELDGVEAITGERPKRFCLLVISKEPPHLVVPVWLSQEDLGWGQRLNRYGRGVYAWCKETGQWPGYSQSPGELPKGKEISMPGWAIKQLENRELAGGFVPPQEVKQVTQDIAA